jgi:multicomponent Na+:H+ antiporter subunit F
LTIANFLLAAAAFVLLMVAIGLARILHGPADVDRVLSVQLLGSGGVAVLLLLSVAVKLPPIMDVALMLGLLATFVSVAFLRDAVDSSSASTSGTEDR